MWFIEAEFPNEGEVIKGGIEGDAFFIFIICETASKNIGVVISEWDTLTVQRLHTHGSCDQNHKTGESERGQLKVDVCQMDIQSNNGVNLSALLVRTEAFEGI